MPHSTGLDKWLDGGKGLMNECATVCLSLVSSKYVINVPSFNGQRAPICTQQIVIHQSTWLTIFVYLLTPSS